ncbi:LysR family transcriptional regulator [Pectobacterium jejuense]|uniref:LysR substrate-binding domain-containing protein n=1 Tax=Pectobacterium jejuense TaxID=2974022 RepID=A0ABW8GUH5_9GAMM
MELSQHVRAILSFVEAADAGSFAAASRQLKISPAAVSKNIANLEKVLGVRLMNRTTRRLALTKEGAVFLEQARIALSALENAVDMIVTEKLEQRGHVKISTSAAFGAEFIVPELPELMNQYANLTVEVDFDDRMTDLVNDGYDIAIRGGRIIDSSLISRPICQMNAILVASPDYLNKYGIPHTPAELKKHVLIARKFLSGRLSPWGFKAKDNSLSFIEPTGAKITLSEPASLARLAALGLGIAQVGVHNAMPYLETGKLKIVLFGQHDAGSYEMTIQYPHRALIAPRVQITVEHLLSKLKNNKVLNVPLSSLYHYCVGNSPDDAS